MCRESRESSCSETSSREVESEAEAGDAEDRGGGLPFKSRVRELTRVCAGCGGFGGFCGCGGVAACCMAAGVGGRKDVGCGGAEGGATGCYRLTPTAPWAL